MVRHGPDTTKKQRSLIIHTGNKTGSTAIQNMLDLYSQAIANLGIDYISMNRDAYFERYQSGNGARIANGALQNASPFELKSLVREVLGPNQFTIISSESFCKLGEQHLSLLRECLEELNIRPVFLVFVREPVEYFRSNYSQMLRMGRALTFDSYLEDLKPSWLHFDFLTALADSWPKQRIYVQSYDEAKSSLFSSFWQNIQNIFGIEGTAPISEGPKEINRSFYLEEMNLLLKQNKVFGGEFSLAVSDYFTYASGYVGTPWRVDQRSIDKIHDMLQLEVKWINETFFNGRQVIRKPTGPEEAGNNPSLDGKLPDGDTILGLLFYVMRNASQISESGLENFLHRINQISQSYGGTCKLNDGTQFDNYYYLLRNSDLVFSNVNPKEHFESYGKPEGRDWRSCDCDNCTVVLPEAHSDRSS